ncbi:MAG: DnaA ATPase domain-containing protein [Thermoguttaceae bacterium]
MENVSPSSSVKRPFSQEEQVVRRSKQRTSSRITKIDYMRFPSLFPQSELEEALRVVNEEKTDVKTTFQPLQTGNSPIRPGLNVVFPTRPVQDVTSPSSGQSLLPSLSPILTSRPQKSAHNPPQTKTEESQGGRKFASLSQFVEGISNRLAKTAADIAVLYPGKMNPIYLYGGTSVGKTHLLEGIWSETRKRRDRKPPLFMTAEQFTTSFIEGLRGGIQGFRNKFRGISVLLLDDIHFFLGKTSTQTELLRTIDTLKNQGVQLVFSGDRPLRDLGRLRPELLARLEAGMVCGIDPAERDTLLTIFEQMVKQRQLPISGDVRRFVVSHLCHHTRQLSGALNRLHAAYLSEKVPPTIQTAELILDDLIRNNRKTVRLPDIESVVCETFGLGSQVLQSKTRAAQVSHPRMLAMWLARKYTRSAFAEIGKYFGDRSHSTVVSAQKKVESWLSKNEELDCGERRLPISEVIQKVERALQSS